MLQHTPSILQFDNTSTSQWIRDPKSVLFLFFFSALCFVGGTRGQEPGWGGEGSTKNVLGESK